MCQFVRLIKTLIITFIFVIGVAGIIGSSGGGGGGDGDNDTNTSTLPSTLVWDNGNWDDKNWK